MTAMILAAGRGERMRPLTDVKPKPLIEVRGKPLIVWHLEKLARNGFKNVVINIAHLGFMIPEVLGDGSKWGVEIVYSDEQGIGALESAGGIINALEHLSEEFLVVNADVWCDYEFNNSFSLNDKLAHLILVENPEHNKDGDFEYKNDKYTFSGIGYYSKKMFKNLSKQKLALAPILRKSIENNEVSFELYKGEWRDIGTPQRLEEINDR
ncbi:N-acetylmuramate alpha-1-phosphate uridylyltransferase MurU [Sulfurimonas sp.]|uniref:N-acetylmuramate alpha-1-phosphate uridylyltransferase MurU n=1 Tax=Sulfurimonas sp. TaxID=2022749 RepID=UPI0035635A69